MIAPPKAGDNETTPVKRLSRYKAQDHVTFWLDDKHVTPSIFGPIVKLSLKQAAQLAKRLEAMTSGDLLTVRRERHCEDCLDYVDVEVYKACRGTYGHYDYPCGYKCGHESDCGPGHDVPYKVE